MKEYRYRQVDAFSNTPYKGNPAAIVLEADSLQDKQMQTIARQMNLPATVFMLRPTSDEADYRVRIFSPSSELPFAGHPTIAAAFTHIAESFDGPRSAPSVLHQECGIGIIKVEISGPPDEPIFTLTMGEPSRTAIDVDRGFVAELLGLTPSDIGPAPVEICSAGLPWMVVPVASLSALTNAKPNLPLIAKTCEDFGAAGLTAYSHEAAHEDCAIHVRSFAPGVGVDEDPSCGSGNGAIAVHRATHDVVGSDAFTYCSEQGLELGREGHLHVQVTRNGAGAERVRLGGQAVAVMKGRLWI